MNWDLDQQYKDVQEDARACARSIEHLAIEADGMSTLHPGIANSKI